MVDLWINLENINLLTIWNLPNNKHNMYLHLFKASSISLINVYNFQNTKTAPVSLDLYLCILFIWSFCKWYHFLIWASSFLFSRSYEIFYIDNGIIYKWRVLFFLCKLYVLEIHFSWLIALTRKFSMMHRSGNSGHFDIIPGLWKK